MMSLLWTAFIGLIAGALAKFLLPGKDPGGIWITMALGVVGALVAEFIGRGLGWYAPGESTSFIGAVIGAILVLWLYRMVKGKKAAA